MFVAKCSTWVEIFQQPLLVYKLEEKKQGKRTMRCSCSLYLSFYIQVIRAISINLWISSFDWKIGNLRVMKRSSMTPADSDQTSMADIFYDCHFCTGHSGWQENSVETDHVTSFGSIVNTKRSYEHRQWSYFYWKYCRTFHSSQGPSSIGKRVVNKRTS